MSNEIATSNTPGQALYALVRNSAGQVWNSGAVAFEAYNATHYSSYAQALAEQGGTGFYVASFPAAITTAGRYSVDIRSQSGALPAVGDAALGGGSVLWNGSAEVEVLTSADKAGYSATVAGYATGEDPATLLLAAPANKVATDSSGRVSVGAYASGQDPASLVLASAANKLATNASGQVQHDMTQAVPTTNTAQTVGDALNAARAQAFGKWVLAGTTLTLYAPDGTTPVHSFTLDSSTNPTART